MGGVRGLVEPRVVLNAAAAQPAPKANQQGGFLIAGCGTPLGLDPVPVVRGGAIQRNVKEHLLALGDVDGDRQAAVLAKLNQQEAQVEGVVASEPRELELRDL